MCFFLTIAVPAVHGDRIREVFDFAHGFRTHNTTNPSITVHLPARFAARLLTTGMCSCDLYARPGAAEETDPTSHLRRRYEKRGWSEAKIQRAVEQSSASAANPKRNRARSGFRDDVIERLVALCHSAGSVAVVVHWYRGDVETERFAVRRVMPCGCDELFARAHALAEDELLVSATRAAI